jgi:hypothetical protein
LDFTIHNFINALGDINESILYSTIKTSSELWRIELKNRYIVDHGKEFYDKYYTGISHKTSSTTRTFDFFSNWRYTPRVSGESKAICSRVQQFEEMG